MADRRVTVASVGDVVLARDDPRDAFTGALELLSGVDVRTCNLEVPLSDRGMPQYAKQVTLHASPRMIEGYTHAGFDVVSLANNHTMDYGPVALMDTIELLDAHGLAYAGAGPDRVAAWEAVYREVNGVRLAFLSYASVAHNGYGATAYRPGIAMIRRDPLFGAEAVSPDDVARMRTEVERAAAAADAVIVFFHWGISQSRSLSVSQRHLAHAAVEAGAHAVVGHHPHVLQGVERYHGVPIVYSLGNFVFDLQPFFFDRATRLTALARIEIVPGGVTGLELVPMHLDDEGRPHRSDAGSPEAVEILRDLHDLSEALGTSVETRSGNAVITLEAISRSGQ